jgi:integrase
LAPKSVRNVHIVIRKALADATRKRLVNRNVAIDADPPKVPGPGEREMATWTPQELKIFLRALADHPFGAAYVLAASTGMRRGEVLGLRWSDVDLDRATVAICQTIVNVAYKVTVSEPKTARGRRTISLDRSTVAILRAHRTQQATEKDAAGAGYGDLDLVFARPDGQPVHPDFFSQTFNRTVTRLGLRRVRLHDYADLCVMPTWSDAA